jgi:hypothetical protein
MYFLKTTDGKVFVQFDYESQDLGARGENPFNSTFQPRRRLLIVRAPKSGFVIAQKFSGDALNAGDAHELSLGPGAWPESETYCAIPWDELQSRLSRKANGR